MRPSLHLLRPPLPRLTAQPLRLTPRRILTTSTSTPTPIDLPTLLVTPGSIHHNSLPTFLAYAARTSLSPTKTYYIGTHYEYTVALSLRRLGFSLLRIGRKNDAGIDLLGHWALPGAGGDPIPVIAQCKSHKCGVRPQHVRELEGSFRGTPEGWKGRDVLGLLVTTGKASKGTLEAIRKSRWPLGYLLVSVEGVVRQFVWNGVAGERGLEGVGVVVRYSPKGEAAGKDEGNSVDKDIQLTWMGTPISSDPTETPSSLTNNNNHIHTTTSQIANEIAKTEGITTGPSPPPKKRGPGRPPKPLLQTLLPNPKRGRPPAKKPANSSLRKPGKRGRSFGSKNKKTLEALAQEPGEQQVKRGRGRPPGAKNKVKKDKAAGAEG